MPNNPNEGLNAETATSNNPLDQKQPGYLNALIEHRNNKITVKSVEVGSAAARAGLQVDDEILSINDDNFGVDSRKSNFRAFMAKQNADALIVIKVLRNGKQIDLSTTLDSESILPPELQEQEDPESKLEQQEAEKQRIADIKARLLVFEALAQQTLETAAESNIDLAEMGECLKLCIHKINAPFPVQITDESVLNLLKLIDDEITKYAQLEEALFNPNFKFNALLATLNDRSKNLSYYDYNRDFLSAYAKKAFLKDEVKKILHDWARSAEGSLDGNSKVFTPMQQQAVVALFEIELKVATRMRGISLFNKYSEDIENWLAVNFEGKTIDQKIQLFFTDYVANINVINAMPDLLKFNLKNALIAVIEGRYSCDTANGVRSFKIKPMQLVVSSVTAASSVATSASPLDATEAAAATTDDTPGASAAAEAPSTKAQKTPVVGMDRNAFINVILGTLALAFKEGLGKHSDVFVKGVINTNAAMIAALLDTTAKVRTNLTTKTKWHGDARSKQIAEALSEESVTYATPTMGR